MEKYLVGTYRAVSVQTWGIKLVKKTTYPGATRETFIKSLMNNITLLKTIAHRA